MIFRPRGSHFTDLDGPIVFRDRQIEVLGGFDPDRNCFADVGERLIARVALRDTAGKAGDFGDEAAVFDIRVKNYLSHEGILAKVEGALQIIPAEFIADELGAGGFSGIAVEGLADGALQVSGLRLQEQRVDRG